MRFEWDQRKSRRNRIKHGISFETAALVFSDPHAVSRLDRIVENEERWQTIGMAGGIAILLVVHTHLEEGGEELIRIISARRATPQETNIYEAGVETQKETGERT
jgi:uncharacterized DUF497 family protein